MIKLSNERTFIGTNEYTLLNHISCPAPDSKKGLAAHAMPHRLPAQRKQAVEADHAIDECSWFPAEDVFRVLAKLFQVELPDKHLENGRVLHTRLELNGVNPRALSRRYGINQKTAK